MQPWALITPASRGIGLHLARRILATTTVPVVATARRDPDHVRTQILADLRGVSADRLHVLPLDVTDEATISSAASECARLFPPSSAYLHLAFVVPGVLHPEKSPAQIDRDDALATFEVNTLGPLLCVKHFSAFLPRRSTALAEDKGLPVRAVWAGMSARVGSIEDNRLGGWYSYRASKAGVNQVVRTFDNHLRSSAGDKAVAVALHPGTVKTGLSEEFWGNVKEGKLFSAEYAAERLVEVVNGLDGERHRGRCLDWKGDVVPP